MRRRERLANFVTGTNHQIRKGPIYAIIGIGICGLVIALTSVMQKILLNETHFSRGVIGLFLFIASYVVLYDIAESIRERERGQA
ncbi:MAG: hypothetical protein WCV69_04790 [Patescibacteria group bacterium]|jgi:hypothetical protein